MGLKLILNDFYKKIGIWTIEESLAELKKQNLFTKDISSKNRFKEILCRNLLLKNLGYNGALKHNKYGAPMIKNDFISISHTKNMVAIIFSKNQVGIDIEKISAQPLKISSKFINKNLHDCLCEKKATLIWSAKEAMYKWHQIGKVNFKKDIKIKPFKVKSNGKINLMFKKNEYTLQYMKIDNHFLVYVCK